MEVGSLRCQVEEAVTTPPLGPQAAIDQQNQRQLSLTEQRRKQEAETPKDCTMVHSIRVWLDNGRR